MAQRRTLRILYGALFGGIAGVSLTTGVFPFAASEFFGGDSSLGILAVASELTVPVSLLWAAGGGALAWLGGARTGALILGACGFASGVVLAHQALGRDLPSLAVGALTGLVYGLLGGLLLGQAFSRPSGSE